MAAQTQGIVKKLDNETISYVKATTVIGSLSRIVEELVFNSLDANSSFIQITLDFEKLTVEVCDDGIGMQQELLRRQQEHSWNVTTKDFCKSGSSGAGCYGCKGEAIAAISTICDVTIFTRPVGAACDAGYSIVVSPRPTLKPPKESSSSSTESLFYDRMTSCSRAFTGTTVVVSNIFHNIPVRRSSVCKRQELQAVEAFIRQTSLLFHEVEFAVLDLAATAVSDFSGCVTGDSTACDGRYIIHYPPVESVASRLIAAHGESALSKMTEVHEELNGYALVGLITPPKREFLHWNSSMQYCYVNKRYCSSSVDSYSSSGKGNSKGRSKGKGSSSKSRMENGDNLMKSLINRLFSDHLLLSSCAAAARDINEENVDVVGSPGVSQSQADDQNIGGPNSSTNGPTAKHYDVNHQKYNLFPCFVLQLHCPDDAYDVLLEPSKSTVLFKQPVKVVQIVRRLFQKLVHSMKTYERQLASVDCGNALEQPEQENTRGHGDPCGNENVFTENRKSEYTLKDVNAGKRTHSFESYSYSPEPGGDKAASTNGPQRKRSRATRVATSADSRTMTSLLGPAGAASRGNALNAVSPATRLMAFTYFVSPKEKLLLRNYTSSIENENLVGGHAAADRESSTCDALSLTNHMSNVSATAAAAEVVATAVGDTSSGEHTVDESELAGVSLLSEFSVSVQRRPQHQQQHENSLTSHSVQHMRASCGNGHIIDVELGLTAARSCSTRVADLVAYYDSLCSDNESPSVTSLSSAHHRASSSSLAKGAVPKIIRPMHSMESSVRGTVYHNAPVVDTSLATVGGLTWAAGDNYSDFDVSITTLADSDVGTLVPTALSLSPEREPRDMTNPSPISLKRHAQETATSEPQPQPEPEHEHEHEPKAESQPAGDSLGSQFQSQSQSQLPPVPPARRSSSNRSSRFFSASAHSIGQSALDSTRSAVLEWQNALPCANKLRELRDQVTRSVPTSKIASPVQIFGSVSSGSRRGGGGEIALKLTREMLRNSTVVGQFDSKYILLYVSIADLPSSLSTSAIAAAQSRHSAGLLICIDQHAADERIRYDAATRALYVGEDGGADAASTNIAADAYTPGLTVASGTAPSVLSVLAVQEPLNFTCTELNCIDYYRDDLKAWGFRWECGNNCSETARLIDLDSGSGVGANGSSYVGLAQVPVILGEPLTSSDFLEFLQHLSLPNSGAVGRTPSLMCAPPAVHRILCSQSCRSAIMFNTALSLQQCVELVHKLGSPIHTQFPFQCAHGRPAIIPLTEMQFE